VEVPKTDGEDVEVRSEIIEKASTWLNPARDRQVRQRLEQFVERATMQVADTDRRRAVVVPWCAETRADLPTRSMVRVIVSGSR